MYKEEKTLEERKNESNRMKERFPTRIACIVEKRNANIQSIDKRKFMSPSDLTLAQFTFVIRKRLKLNPSEAIFIFINNQLAVGSKTIGDMYTSHKDEDGFLYFTYDFENTFGYESFIFVEKNKI